MWHSDAKRREYQLGSLFNDVSLLSPVQEEEESFDSPLHSRTLSALLPPARAYSPLPPLIIEVEKRVDKHDHPEEFYLRLERKMRRIYRRLFIEGRNVSSDMSMSTDYDGYSNDDKRSEEMSNGNIDITAGTDDGGNIEPVVISDRSPKRRINNDSSESDEEEVKAKKSRSNDSSSADVLPRSSSSEEFDDETVASSIAEEHGHGTEDATEETEYANVDIARFIADERIDDSYNVVRDDFENTSESLDYIRVTFQADVHRAYSDNEPNDHLPPASVQDAMDDEMDDDSGDDSANESVQDPEAADEEIEEMPENNAVPGNNASSAPDRGDDITTHCTPADIRDQEPADEEILETLEKDEVPGNNASSAPDRGDDITTHCTPADIRDQEPPPPADEEILETLEKDEVPGNKTMIAPERGDVMTTPRIQPDNIEPVPLEICEALQNNKVPYNTLSAPTPDREVELMRSPLIRLSAGSLPEHFEDSSHGDLQIDFEFLNRTQDKDVDDDPLEERDAGTQTSLEERNGPEVWGNIFYGPRVFKLCRCRNHSCS